MKSLAKRILEKLSYEDQKKAKIIPTSKYTGPDLPGFMIDYTYPGDNLSDYKTSLIILKAKTFEEAKRYFEEYEDVIANITDNIPQYIGKPISVRAIPSILAYKKQYPNGNFDILIPA